VIDTHCHLLPTLDDGAASLEESLRMAAGMAAGGVREIVCTPHLTDPAEVNVEHVRAVFDETEEAIARAGLPLRLHLGYEISFPSALELGPQGIAPYGFGADGRCLLIEVPHHTWPPFAEDLVFRLRVAGFLPLLGHPERNERLRRDPDLLRSLRAAGAVAQGTAASFHGLFGNESRRGLLRMITDGQITLLATDAHHGRPVTWGLDVTAGAIADRLPGLDPEPLVRDNPAALLAGQEPLVPAALSRPGVWDRLFRRQTA